MPGLVTANIGEDKAVAPRLLFPAWGGDWRCRPVTRTASSNMVPFSFRLTLRYRSRIASKCAFTLPRVTASSGNITCEATIPPLVTFVMSQFEVPTEKEEYSKLAVLVRNHLDMETVYRLAGLNGRRPR